MSNRLFQGVIYQMKETVGRTVGVTDETGVIVACSELSRIDGVKEGIRAERMTNSVTFTHNGYTYRGFSNSKRNDYYVFVEGVLAIVLVLAVGVGSCPLLQTLKVLERWPVGEVVA